MSIAWDQGVKRPSAVTPRKLTAARVPQITIAGGQDVTAGKVMFCITTWKSS